MKIAVIGSGISGLSIANMLNKEHDVVVYERNDKPGGLIKCERVDDCLFHKVGGHVFNSKNQKVLEWFWSYFDIDKEFVSAKRNAKVLFDNRVIGYPIENFLYELPKQNVKNIINELLEIQSNNKISPFEYPNFEEFLKGNFGNTLYEIYFKPYNSKIWNIDLSSVSMAWLEGKLPMPNLNQILESNILRETEGEMVHSSFYYPKEGGSQFIVDRLKKNVNIICDTEVVDIPHIEGKYIIGDEKYDKIIFCGDIRKLPESFKKTLAANEIDVDYLMTLRSNGTSNLFCETDPNDISWLYIPQSFTKAHRIIYTGNFSDTNNRGSKRKTCVVEFSGKVSLEQMKEEIKKLPGNLHPLAYNYEPNSYVIQDSSTRGVVDASKKVLEEEGIYLLGRFAEWEYYNMDKAIESAFSIKAKIDIP